MLLISKQTGKVLELCSDDKDQEYKLPKSPVKEFQEIESYDEETFKDLDITKLTSDDMSHLKDCFFIQNVGIEPTDGEVYGYNSDHDHYTRAKFDMQKTNEETVIKTIDLKKKQ